MHTPTIYTPESLKKTTEGICCGLPDDRIVACRPESWGGLGLRERIKCAWLVFTGRADVLKWTGQP